MAPTGFDANHPRASVVMSVYNDLRFLDEAVDSVLRQTFEDFEFIIVDDGTGNPAVKSLESRDPRVKVVVNASNVGAAAACNRGIAKARSEIIVRLDADDVAEPTRIERLLAELDRDPDLGLVGSAVTFIDEESRAHTVQPMPESDLDVRWTMLFHNPFYHPTTAFRRTCFEAAGGYAEDQPVSHDHYLWFHMLDLCRARNLPQPLVRYRVNPRGLTAVHAQDNPRGRTHPIRKELWNRLGLAYSLCDNALAADISRFMRGYDIEPARRGPAYELILTTLHVFAAKMRSSARVDDDDALRRLVAGLVARVLEKTPESESELRNILRLSAAFDLSER